ncbi:YbaB/EbfC family nucleoid-associated protein [Saccharothrix deserti]|uniref:YbaB/EbfC family nucleoid-associated protein n=1 Tax=Saccharothrix deserti TaxID=2593674 RepID=UPI00131D6360|nr:YbaB/EbfC family nucleoid-associated protein [Saccharothrix deserti]
MTMPGNLFGGDPSEVERGLDEWVSGFERKAAQYQVLQQRVEGVRLSATSPNGVVTVTVDADGSLVDATFTDGIVRTTPDELSRQLLIALSRAKAQITERVREVAGETVGEDGAERIAGYYAQKFAGLGEPDQGAVRPEQRQRRPPDEDEFGEGSVYDQR